ncbi:MAG TPA: SPW repeat protein [Anaeromyxobacteraceae bacterium]|nr:SPW repeat protein [Anaeromyxobacteraceae bacterium]
MVARWSSFAAGLWLMIAPLVLGHATAAAVLHDVAMGLLVCVASLAAFEWPAARFSLLAPAAWLVSAPRTLGWDQPAVEANQVALGIAVAVLAVVPSARLLRRRDEDASKMAA